MIGGSIHAPARPLGLRLAPAAVPATAWNRWTVVARTHGFHVSRESANGTRTEALLNDVRKVKVFRSEKLAIEACNAANFAADAERLKAEPLMGGKAGAQ